MYEERSRGNITFLRYDKLVVHPARRDVGLYAHSPTSSNRGLVSWRSFRWRNYNGTQVLDHPQDKTECL